MTDRWSDILLVLFLWRTQIPFKHQSANVNSEHHEKRQIRKGWREMWICYQLSDWQLNSLPQRQAAYSSKACIPYLCPSFSGITYDIAFPVHDLDPAHGLQTSGGEGTCFRGHASFSDGCALPIHGWSPDTYEVSSLLGCRVRVRTTGLSVLDPDYNPAPGPDTLDGIPRKTPGPLKYACLLCWSWLDLVSIT